MEPQQSSQDEREVRAARNQALFRAVNEQIRSMNEALATATGSVAIACECADTNCVETLEISAEEYRAIRAEPRRFAVLPGHVYPDVEEVVRESGRFVVVEKTATAGAVAEALDARWARQHITSAVAVTDAGDADGVRWLETVAAACERVLARDDGDPRDPLYRQLRDDVEALLARVRARLDD